MKNFIFKSTTADLQKILQSFEIRLDIQNNNILYITHECDKILKIVKELELNKRLQRQVDDYMDENDEDKSEHIPEE